VNVDDAAQRTQVDHRGDEFVRDALDSMAANLAPRAQRGRLGRFYGMDTNVGGTVAEITSHTHDRSSGANAGDKGIRDSPHEAHLLPDLRSRRRLMGDDVVVVRKLTREENSRVGRCQLLGHPDGTEKPPFVSRHEPHLGS
jgi:hypothetical protein